MDHIIIGGGASGLMLAAQLDIKNTGSSGLILEKTSRPGSKLLMSGGGRCNITHGGRMKDFVSAYGDAGRRLRKCLYRHSNIELASWLESHGIGLADEHGRPLTCDALSDAGRIFPASMKASDVLACLLAAARSNGWELRTGSEVTGLSQISHSVDRSDYGPEDRSDDAPCCWKVSLASSEVLYADNVIIASGGVTFPETGSDGSMLRIAERLGIQIMPPRSALAPVYVSGYPYGSLSGTSLDDVIVRVFSPANGSAPGRKVSEMAGSILFTHSGFSGPVILNISRYAEPGDRIELSYGRSLEELPRRMQRVITDRARGESGDVRTSVLESMLRSDSFTVTSIDAHGMVTAGGISLDEIDASSMQLRRYPGLYAIGEAIDADGITGGYNLQMCWSTAATAAETLFL